MKELVIHLVPIIAMCLGAGLVMVGVIRLVQRRTWATRAGQSIDEQTTGTILLSGTLEPASRSGDEPLALLYDSRSQPCLALRTWVDPNPSFFSTTPAFDDFPIDARDTECDLVDAHGGRCKIDLRSFAWHGVDIVESRVLAMHLGTELPDVARHLEPRLTGSLRVFESVLTERKPVVVYGRLREQVVSSPSTEDRFDGESAETYRSSRTIRVLDGEVDHGGGWIQVHGEPRLWLRDRATPALLMTLGVSLILQGGIALTRPDPRARQHSAAMSAPACDFDLNRCSYRGDPVAPTPVGTERENDDNGMPHDMSNVDPPHD